MAELKIPFSSPSSRHTLELPSGVLATIVIPLEVTRDDRTELAEVMRRLANAVESGDALGRPPA